MHDEFERLLTTANEAREKMELVNSMASFVRSGLGRPPMDTHHGHMDGVVNAILATLAVSLANATPDNDSPEAVRERLITAYLRKYNEQRRLYNQAAAPVRPLTAWPQEQVALSDILGGKPLITPKVTPTPKGALEMAWHNVYRAQQRWLVWDCLGAMFQKTTASRGIRSPRFASPEKPSAETHNFNAVAQALHSEMRRMERYMLMFALVVGGEDAERARQWVLEGSLSEGFSVMEYLTPDAGIPARWCTADEQAFRTALKALVKEH